PEKAYAQGDTVRQGQRLYQAAQPVPANAGGGNAPPNATYWLDIGQVAQEANALAAQVQSNTTRIDETDTGLAAVSEKVEGVYSQINPPLAGDTGWNAGSTA
ncbi:hypothetical protein O4H25_13730, partial [Staphylococcus equorum]|uniref:hypothetical protein n=1 Tax=Staphylococcus equorum TaxID=246432 RepID=UPI0022AE950B